LFFNICPTSRNFRTEVRRPLPFVVKLPRIEKRMLKENERQDKQPIAFLVGGGSMFPAILEAHHKKGAPFYPSLVVSHKKESPQGVELARREGLNAFYFNFVQLKNKLKDKGGISRKTYDELLGALVSQSYYKPKGVVMAGWDLVLSEHFLNYFSREDGFWNVINLHPALLPDENTDTFTTSKGTTIPVLRGVECLETAWNQHLPITGCTVHFATPTFDVGPVIVRSEIEPDYKNESFESFSKRFHEMEKKALVEAIELFASDKITIKNGKVIRK